MPPSRMAGDTWQIRGSANYSEVSGGSESTDSVPLKRQSLEGCIGVLQEETTEQVEPSKRSSEVCKDLASFLLSSKATRV